MEYISHEDFKGYMNKFQAETPKGLLKEDFERPDAREMEEEDELGRITDVVYAVFAKDNLTSEKTVDSLAEDIRNEWSRTRGYGKGDEIDFTVNYLKDWVEEARSEGGGPGLGSGSKLSRGENNTIWGDDWESVIDSAAASLSEGNAFTAGLAKAKKGEKFKVDGKTVKDTSNYDASIKEADDEVDTKLTKIAGLYKGKAVKHEEIEKIVKALTGQGHEVNVRYVQEFLKNHDVELDEASYTDNYPGSWGYREGYSPDSSDFEQAIASELQTLGDEDLTDEEYEKALEALEDPKIVGQLWGIHPKKAAMALAKMVRGGESLNEFGGHGDTPDNPKLQAAAKYLVQNKDKFLTQDHFSKHGIRILSSKSDKELYDYIVNDMHSDGVYAIVADMKSQKEGLHMPPLQATGQTIVANEDQAPYGFSVLSPDERKQLKEYINSVKTIKQEIAKLLEKAGKSGKIMEDSRKEEDEKVPAERKPVYHNPTKKAKPGGNRTDLVMTKAEMWEGEEHGKHSLSDRLHSTFAKVTDLAIKELVAGGLDQMEAVSFLKQEIEEKAKEAMMGQYDL